LFEQPLDELHKALGLEFSLKNHKGQCAAIGDCNDGIPSGEAVLPVQLDRLAYNERPPGSAGERKRSFVGHHFWARGYFVSTVGRDEAVIREYIKHQEHEDTRLDQLHLWR